MYSKIRNLSFILALTLTTTTVTADESILFNGKNLDGWTWQMKKDEENPQPVEKAWLVRDGLLISTGACQGVLVHKTSFEDYELTLEYRSMQRNAGLVVSGTGSVLVHTAADQPGSFRYPKSIEVPLFTDTGSVYFRDVEPFSKKKWAFRASDIRDDFEKDMEEWNHVKIICRGNQLTVLLNGSPINHVEGLNRKQGAVALTSSRGSIQAPAFYRNIKVTPLPAEITAEEKAATTKLAALIAKAAKEDADREAARKAEMAAEERREKVRAEGFARLWANIEVQKDLEFSDDARKLPFPTDTRDLQFDATFGDIELSSGKSMSELSKFYRTEMARRGWNEVEKDRDEESIEVTFKHGNAQVELELDQEDDGTDVSLDCRGLSFKGTNDPAALAALGLPQPQAYLVLQKTFTLPGDAHDLEYESGNRCLFKTGVKLQQAYDQLTGQLRSQGFQETRRPIISDNRRYSEFAKGGTEISVNMFVHGAGSRAVLSYEGR